MEANEKDQKIKELTEKVEFLSTIIIKAHKYAKNDPEVALTQARKSAEAICKNIFSAEIGEPGKIMLDELIKKLAEKKILPTKILVPLGTIQAYGNYGTHAQSATETIDFNYVTPCLSALAQVSSWYFTEYLKTTMPAGLADEKSMAAAVEASSSDTRSLSSQGSGSSNAKSGTSSSHIGLYSAIAVVVIGVGTLLFWFLTAPKALEQQPATTVVSHKDSTRDAVGKHPADSQEAQKTQPVGTLTPLIDPHPGQVKNANPMQDNKTGKQEKTSVSEIPAVSGPTTEPVVTKEVPPQYPESMKGSKVEGGVSLKITVGLDGVPTDVSILSYDDERFERAAIEAGKQYRFKPALANGKPVQGLAYVKLEFKEQ